MSRKFLLHKGVDLQCVEQFGGFDGVADVLVQEAGDEIQQFESFVAAAHLDRKTVHADPALKLDHIDLACKEASELSGEVRD